MKKKKILLFISVLLLIAISFIVCIVLDNNSYKKEVELNETFKLPINKTVIVKDENLKLKLISVGDSRCKDGWQCIWEGEINYTIKVNDEKIELGTVTTKSVDYKDYRILLGEENDSTKCAMIKIVKWR